MFKNEIKNNLKEIYEDTKNIDSNFISIKVALHNLQKLGYKCDNFDKLLDNIGIEFYKFKNELKDTFGIKVRL